MPTQAPPESGKATPKRARAKRISVIGLIAILGIGAYLVSILAYSASGQSTVRVEVPKVERTESGFNVDFDAVAMDPVKNQMTIRLAIQPSGDFYDEANVAFAKSVRVIVPLQTSGTFTKDIKAGEPLSSGSEFPLYVEGRPQTYPFDRYFFGLRWTDEDIAPDIPKGVPISEYDGTFESAAPLIYIVALSPTGKPILDEPIRIGMAGPPIGLQGWSEQWSFYTFDSQLYSAAVIKRSGGVLAFVIVVLILMITVGVLAATVAYRVAKKQRPIFETMASWFAALLFALIPLRINMPNAPPIGAWIDVTVFYWVEVALLASMSVFIISWLRFRRAPTDSS